MATTTTAVSKLAMPYILIVCGVFIVFVSFGTIVMCIHLKRRRKLQNKLSKTLEFTDLQPPTSSEILPETVAERSITQRTELTQLPTNAPKTRIVNTAIVNDTISTDYSDRMNESKIGMFRAKNREPKIIIDNTEWSALTSGKQPEPHLPPQQPVRQRIPKQHARHQPLRPLNPKLSPNKKLLLKRLVPKQLPLQLTSRPKMPQKQILPPTQQLMRCQVPKRPLMQPQLSQQLDVRQRFPQKQIHHAQPGTRQPLNRQLTPQQPKHQQQQRLIFGQVPPQSPQRPQRQLAPKKLLTQQLIPGKVYRQQLRPRQLAPKPQRPNKHLPHKMMPRQMVTKPSPPHRQIKQSQPQQASP